MSDRTEPSSIVSGLGIWLLLQLLALMLPAARVELSHRYPTPVESTAVEVMVGTQVVAGAMLGPMLFRTRAGAIAAVCTSIPMLAASALLAGSEVVRCASPAAFVALWLLAVACWVRATSGSLVSNAALSGWAVGGGVLHYLKVEFGRGASDTLTSVDLFLGPLPSVLSMVGPMTEWGNLVWLIPLSTGVLALIFKLALSRHFIHRVIHSPAR